MSSTGDALGGGYPSRAVRTMSESQLQLYDRNDEIGCPLEASTPDSPAKQQRPIHWPLQPGAAQPHHLWQLPGLSGLRRGELFADPPVRRS